MKNRRVKIAALAFAIMSGLCTAPVSATVLMEPFAEEADTATSLDTGEYRSLQQENYVTVQVKKIIADMKLAGCSDDEKIKAVYDYITRTVDYDYKGINDNSSHSAYAALYRKKAVCQGYSTLMYRLLRECGISNRIITGKSQNQAHAWNIVPVNGCWYNLDATWDSNFDGNDQKYIYFLKGSSDFADHTRDPEFLTAEFLAKYPVSTSAYAR